MRADAEIERDLLGGFVDVESGSSHRPQVFDRSCDSKRDVLSRRRPRMMVWRGIDSNAGRARMVVRGPEGQIT